jgi:hypothetical protein
MVQDHSSAGSTSSHPQIKPRRTLYELEIGTPHQAGQEAEKHQQQLVEFQYGW